MTLVGGGKKYEYLMKSVTPQIAHSRRKAYKELGMTLVSRRNYTLRCPCEITEGGWKKKMTKHVVVVPFPSPGHLNPMVQLGLRLASIEGVTVTFACAQRYLEPLLKGWEASGVLRKVLESSRISFRAIPDDATGRSPDTDSKYDNDLLHGRTRRDPDKEPFENGDGLRQPLLELLTDRVLPEHDGLLSCIISDVLVVSGHQIASQLGVPWICYFPLSASSFLINHNFPELYRQNVFNPVSSPSDILIAPPNAKIPHVQGLPPLLGRDLLRFPVITVMNADKINLGKAHNILFNTVDALEPKQLQAGKQHFGFSNLLPVGPLLPPEFLITANNHPEVAAAAAIASVYDDEDCCLSWLDRAKAPVLYISFGSTGSLDGESRNKLMQAVIDSEVWFLWVIRKDAMEEDEWKQFASTALSTGRGLVVKWAPQLKVLKHPAIGAFLSNCGWNSTLEAICAGVPILGWPHFHDHFVNAKLCADVWKIGLVYYSSQMMDITLAMLPLIKEILGNKEFKNRAQELGRECRAFFHNTTTSNLKSLLESLP